MTALHIQLKRAYEVAGFSPEQIAEEFSLQPLAVKSALMQCSSKYRRDCSKEPEEESKLNFTQDQEKQVMQRMYQIAMESEDEHLVFKACAFIRDDRTGRKDAVAKVQQAGNTINILQFNEMLAAARSKSEALRDKVTNGNNVIELEEASSNS